MSMREKTDLPQRHQWECGWQEHEQMQIERLACLPFAERLAWLEEAHRLVIQLKIAKSSSHNDFGD
jgi:hypothetical protein